VLALSFYTGLASALFVTGFQPFLALQLTGREHGLYTASMLLLVWKLYLVDRTLEHPEDENPDDSNAAGFVHRFRSACLALLAALGGAQIWLIWQEPRLFRAIAVTLAVSVFYFVKVPVLGKRAKEIPYFKCFYLSGSALMIVAAYTPGIGAPTSTSGVAAWTLSFVLYFLNFSLYDIKDVEADARANIKTLAATLPLARFLDLQLWLSLAALGASLWLLPGATGRVLGAVSGFHAFMSFWLKRHQLTAATCGVIDCGYGLILGSGTLLLLHA
jgi:hypothetical protein